MKKIISVLLCAVLLFSFSSCKSGNSAKKKSETAEKVTANDKELTVLYSKTDGFNPYTAKTQENRELCRLLFDSLVNIKSDFTPEYCLSSGAEILGNTCTVHLRAINFSDSTPLLADDVIYSFNMAKSSVSSGYANSLAEIASAAALDSYTVVFTAYYYDPYIVNLLTFPIIKHNSAGLTDSDGVELSPIGSGKYTVSDDGLSLLRNENYFGIRGQVEKIKLLNAPDAESISHYVEAGSADIYYTDAAAGKIVRMSGKRSEVNLNRLVYIGINSTYGALASKEMRYAISSAVDRSELATSAYYGVAKPAKSFYNPSFSDVKPTSSLEETANSEITVENLGKLGYNVKDDSGFYTNSGNRKASFKLLVNSDNVSRLTAARLIAAQCKNSGIEIIIEETDYADYINRIASGSFQLYLGETEILPNMDMAPLTAAGGKAAYGVTETPTGTNQLTVTQAITAFRAGTIGINDLSGVLLTEMPQIPLCYRNGLLFYADKIDSGVEGLLNNVYYSIEKYKFER